MSRLTLFRVGFLFLILFFTTTAKAQKEAETFNVDSTLYEYYQRCQEYLLEPVVLNMSDTLFRMAGERQDERMQAVAIATQLDYYYFQGTNEDSVIHYTNKVKEFAKATHQPKYYYFAWANRLITYYLKTSRTNIALYEVQNMLKEAQKEDDKDAAQQQRIEDGFAGGLAAEHERPVGGVGKQDAEDVVQHIAPAVGGGVAEQPVEQGVQQDIQQGGQHAEDQIGDNLPVLL